MADTADHSNWICHSCNNRNFQPLRNDGSPTCPHCLEGFVEELDPSAVDEDEDEGEGEGEGPALNPIMGGGAGGILGGLLGALLGGGRAQPQPQAQQRGDAGEGENEWEDVPDEGVIGATGQGEERRFFRAQRINGPNGTGAMLTFQAGPGPGMGMGARGAGGQGGEGGVMNLTDFLQAAFAGAPQQPGQHDADHDHGRQQGQQQGGLMDLPALLTQMLGGGPAGFGAGRFGDYVFSQEGLDNIITQLMDAGGGQAGPVAAPEEVIEKLPKFVVTKETLAEEKITDCAVCKDDLVAGDQVARLPCAHIYHQDCILPWLKSSGTCPVCRYELVPQHPTADTTNPSSSSDGNPTAATQSGSGTGSETEQRPPLAPRSPSVETPSPLANSLAALFNANASAREARASASASASSSSSNNASSSSYAHAPPLGDAFASSSSSVGTGQQQRGGFVRMSGAAAGTEVRGSERQGEGEGEGEGRGRRRRSRSRSRSRRGSRSRSREGGVVMDELD